MHSYPLNLASGAARDFTAQADLFVYESGAVTPDTGDLRIIVKPDTGGEIVLRPGQRFRLAPGAKATNWNVKANDGAVAITGNLIIGAGEFDDANTLNTFKLDGTFTNTVKVNNTTAERVPVELDAAAGIKINNTTAQRVPVSLDVSQTQPVSIVGTVNVAGQIVNYTNAYAEGTVGLLTAQLFSAAQNPNGAYVEYMAVSATNRPGNDAFGGEYTVSFLAKATMPANATDGDVIFNVKCANSSGTATNGKEVNQILPVRVKIAAGKGLFMLQGANGLSAAKTVLYTLL